MIQICLIAAGPWFEEQILKNDISYIQQHYLQH